MPSGKNIILDDTNCFRWLRNRFRDLAFQYTYHTTLIFLDVPIAEIEKRITLNNQTKTRHTVKSEIIEGMKQTFEPPQPDEHTICYKPEQSIDKWIVQNFS